MQKKERRWWSGVSQLPLLSSNSRFPALKKLTTESGPENAVPDAQVQRQQQGRVPAPRSRCRPHARAEETLG